MSGRVCVACVCGSGVRQACAPFFCTQIVETGRSRCLAICEAPAMFGADVQKYTTLLFTAGLAPMLRPLHQMVCSHTPGTHAMAGGAQLKDGTWNSASSAAYPTDFNMFVCDAIITYIVGREVSAVRSTTAPPPKPTELTPVTRLRHHRVGLVHTSTHHHLLLRRHATNLWPLLAHPSQYRRRRHHRRPLPCRQQYRRPLPPLTTLGALASQPTSGSSAPSAPSVTRCDLEVPQVRLEAATAAHATAAKQSPTMRRVGRTQRAGRSTIMSQRPHGLTTLAPLSLAAAASSSLRGLTRSSETSPRRRVYVYKAARKFQESTTTRCSARRCGSPPSACSAPSPRVSG